MSGSGSGSSAATGKGSLNHFEDFTPGRIFQHHWGRTISEAEAISFATECLMHEPALFNRVYAADAGHPDIVVSPFLVYAMTLGLSVEDLSEAGGPFLGSDEVVFDKPVYPGDTIFAQSKVLSRRLSRSRSAYGIVEWLTIGSNQRGERVVSFRRSNLVPCRAPQSPGDQERP
jgi:itaconyl-CoA hydratase